jgi:hypothetical protein
MRSTTLAIIARLAACGGEMTPDVGDFTVTDSVLLYELRKG